jgi:hypothetical protein
VSSSPAAGGLWIARLWGCCSRGGAGGRAASNSISAREHPASHSPSTWPNP